MIGRFFDKKTENGVREVELEYFKKRDMWIRPGHSDKETLRECFKDYPSVDVKGKVVVDIGAHIGGFTKIALENGVSQIISYEPDEFNFDLLNVNINDERSILQRAAVISGDDSEVTLYSNGSNKSSASGSINKIRGSISEQTVPAYNFDKILREYRPQIVKMDIEGGEYNLLLDYDIPDFVEEIAIEMHGFNKNTKPLMFQLRNKFHNGKWNIVHEEEQVIFGKIALIVAHYKRSDDTGGQIHDDHDVKTVPADTTSSKPMSSPNESSLSDEINKLCHDHFDEEIGRDFRFFVHKVNERIEWQYGLRETYEEPENLPALGPDVEYFGFHLLMDDRMRYIAQNLVAIPDSKLSPPNKICNTLISHFYGARGIHQTVTGIEDPGEAHVDFIRMLADNNYRLQMRQNLMDAGEANIPIYGSTELRTSLFGASNAHVTQKYDYPERNTDAGNILEWVGDFIKDGTIDKILKVASLKDMFKILTSKKGIGNYYGYHGATSNSVNPALPFDHDERFVVPGPGSSKTAILMFPGLSKKQVSLGDRVIWVRENQEWILEGLKIHEFFYNLPDYNGDPIFPEDIRELKSYTTEVAMCQYGIFRRLRENPHLASRRKVSRKDDNIEKQEKQCVIELKETKKPKKKDKVKVKVKHERKSDVAIDIVSGNNLSASINSHRTTWAYLIANQFETRYGKSVDVLHKGAPWDGYKSVILYHGMGFNGLLNLFTGANEGAARKLERISKFEGRLVSLDIPMPDYGKLGLRRLKTCDEYWLNVDWDAISDRCAKIKTVRHVNKTDRLVIGDSHACSVYEPGQMVIRLDHKTMYGATEYGIDKLIEENGVSVDSLKQLTLYFGNIDVRHHLARQTDIKQSIQTLVRNYVKSVRSLGINNIELVELLPIEDESRKIPKTGWYGETPFYGSWRVRNNIRKYMNQLMEKCCDKFDWKFYKHPKAIYNEAGQLSFDAMEKPRNVHLSSAFYRWDLRNNKPNEV